MAGDPIPPRDLFPGLEGWRPIGVHDAVFAARGDGGSRVVVRADDGLLLEQLPGAPLHDARWRGQPERAAEVIADALLLVSRFGVTHGDMCLPNLLGDLGTGRLSGIVDWGDAGRFGREIDVASAIWSCAYNGYPPAVAEEVLRRIDWHPADGGEVARLSGVWERLAGPAEEPGAPLR